MHIKAAPFCHMALDMIYNAFFCEFPLESLSAWDSFIAVHLLSDPPIETLQDFSVDYAQILAAFQTHNFVEEYALKYTDTPGYRPNHTSTLECEANLESLRRAIVANGSKVVQTRIDDMYWSYRDYDYASLRKNTRSPFQNDIMTLLSQYKPRVPFANIPVNTRTPQTGDMRVSELLTQLRTLQDTHIVRVSI